MKPIGLCLAFSAAQFAVCAPVPRDSMDSRDRISDREHDATPSSAWLVDNDHQGGAPAPNGENPQMLPRPKTHQLSLLRPLAMHRMPNGETHRDPENDVMRLPHHVHDEHEHGHDHFGPPDLNSVGPPQPGMPCYQGQASHDRNDMLIVYLAAAFMVVVVVMEAWGVPLGGKVRFDSMKVLAGRQPRFEQTQTTTTGHWTKNVPCETVNKCGTGPT